jgi:transketolase
VYSRYAKIGERGEEAEQKWEALFREYQQKYPKEGAELRRRIDGKLPEGEWPVSF